MMKLHVFCCAALAAGFHVIPVSANALTSGPPDGTEITPVMVYAPVGPHKGEEFDAAALAGKGSGALLFIHELTRNGLPVVRALDQIGAEHALLGFRSFTCMLSDDRTAAETRLKAVNGSLKLNSPIVLNLDGADGPGNYALNRKAVLTLIMLKEGKVHRSRAFTDVNAEDADVVKRFIQEVAGSLPKEPAEIRKLAGQQLPNDEAELRDLAAEQSVEILRLRGEVARLRARMAAGGGMRGARERMMRRDGGEREGPPAAERGGSRDDSPPRAEGATKRQGRPPDDPQLNQLLRTFIRKTHEDPAVEEIYREIVERASTSDALHAETIEMFKLMLSFRDRYGTEKAQSLAESFLKESAGKEPR